MSKTAKVFLVSANKVNVDFIERCISSRYKFVNRGRVYAVDNAFEMIQKEKPDVIIINHIIPMFFNSHNNLIFDINSVESYSPKIVFTYFIPEEEEKNEKTLQTLEKIHSAGVKYAFNLRNLGDDEIRDKLKCIIEDGGEGIDEDSK